MNAMHLLCLHYYCQLPERHQFDIFITSVPFLQSSKETLLGYVVCPITGSIRHDSQLWRHLLTAWLEQTTVT